jgi:hypothetical protein
MRFAATTAGRFGGFARPCKNGDCDTDCIGEIRVGDIVEIEVHRFVLVGGYDEALEEIRHSAVGEVVGPFEAGANAILERRALGHVERNIVRLKAQLVGELGRFAGAGKQQICGDCDPLAPVVS